MANNRIINQRTTQSFLKALQASIWSYRLDPVFFENLTPDQWSNIVKMSHIQTVEGLVCNSIQNLPQELLPNNEILMKWIVRQQRVISYNEDVSKKIAFTQSLFDEKGIKSILLKGNAVAQYYPNPKLRTGGDVDWYFPKISDFQRANKLMAHYGRDFNIHSGSDTDYWLGNVPIEHHSKLINLYNPFVQKFINLFEKEEESFVRSISIAGKTVRILSPIAEILLVNSHILHHQIGNGIGLRQFCDSAILYKNLYGKYDNEKLIHVFKKLGILKWIQAHHAILVDVLEIEEKYLPFSPRKHSKWNDETLEIILKVGNFSFFALNNSGLDSSFSVLSRSIRLFQSFSRNIWVAPMEAVSFPLIQVYSKYIKSFKSN